MASIVRIGRSRPVHISEIIRELFGQAEAVNRGVVKDDVLLKAWFMCQTAQEQRKIIVATRDERLQRLKEVRRSLEELRRR